MDEKSMEDYLGAIQASRSGEELWSEAVTFFKAKGIAMMSYHHVPPPTAINFQQTLITAEGFPEKWVEHYVRRRLFDFDPIPSLALTRADPYRWSEVDQFMVVSQEQRAYLEELKNAQIGDGLAIPVYGPAGRNGYVGLGFGAEFEEKLSILEIKELQWLCQATHMRYCELVAEVLPQPAKLSKREHDVLHWVARGKSNADISAIMDLSPNTVDTYLRRIFAKLNVSDRVTAAVKGVGSGLIQLT